MSCSGGRRAAGRGRRERKERGARGWVGGVTGGRAVGSGNGGGGERGESARSGTAAAPPGAAARPFGGGDGAAACAWKWEADGARVRPCVRPCRQRAAIIPPRACGPVALGKRTRSHAGTLSPSPRPFPPSSSFLFYFFSFVYFLLLLLFIFFFPGSVTLAPGPKEFFFKQTMDKRKVAAPGEFPRYRRGAAGCAAQLAPHLPTFRLCFRLGKSRACPPTPDKGHFPSAAARPSAGSRLGEYRRNLSAVTLFPCRCAPRFLLLPWRRGCVYPEDGFRENVFASPLSLPPPPLFFSLSCYTGLARHKQVEQNMFLFISSQIIHSNDGKKILMTMTLAARGADSPQL